MVIKQDNEQTSAIIGFTQNNNIKRGDNELTRKEKRMIAYYLEKGLEARIPDLSKCRFLDIGGGYGEISHFLAPRFAELVVVENDPKRMERICKIYEDTPNLKVVEKDFLEYVPSAKFSAVMLAHILFLMPRHTRDEFLKKAIEITEPSGYLVVVLNSITPREGNQVHFREYMRTRRNIIRGTSDTVEEKLKSWGYYVEVEKVEISHLKQSPKEMVDLISLVLQPAHRYLRRKIFKYVTTYLQKPEGYNFYSDQEILWTKKVK